MKTFNAFLLEAKADGSPDQVFEPLTDRPAPYYLNKYCPDLFWMLTENAPFYRGMHNNSLGLSYVDLTKTKRKSENTSNWYTEIFDNHPEMKDYPKRSKSLICTTDLEYATSFGSMTYVVLPVKNAKIGEVRERDIWDLDRPIDVFGYEEPIAGMNDFLSDFIELGLKTEKCSFELLREFDRQIKDDSSEVFNRIQNSDYSGVLDSDEFMYEFLESILKAYSPSVLGFEASTPATFRHSGDQEVWFDTGAIIIPFDEWEKMRNVLKTARDVRNWEDLLEVMENENI